MCNRPSRRGKRYQVYLYPHVAELLRQTGRGNLSRGITTAANARSFTRYTEERDDIQELIDAYDDGAPLDEHVAKLAKLLNIYRPPSRTDLRPAHAAPAPTCGLCAGPT